MQKKNIDISKIEVPVRDSEGKTVYEPLNQGGKQSDGSMWYKPEPLIPEDHKHYFLMDDPSSREAKCRCGTGGSVYPHTTILKEGHIYNLKGKLII